MATATERKGVLAPGVTGEETGSSPLLHPKVYLELVHRAIVESAGFDGAGLVARTAARSAFSHFSSLPGWESGTPRECFAMVSGWLRETGIGSLEAEDLSRSGGRLVLQLTPGDEAVPAGVADPLWPLVEGIAEGALAAVYQRGSRLEPGGDDRRWRRSYRFQIGSGDVPVLEEPYPVPPFDEAPYAPRPVLDEESMSLLLEHGLPSLTPVWPEYVARLAYDFERELPRARGSKFTALPGLVLTEAAHRGAFATYGALLRSAAWRELADGGSLPSDSWLDALLEVTNTLRIGIWRVESVVAGGRLTLRVYGSHEALGYRLLYGRSSTPRCYFARGVAAAVMNLLSYSSLASEPELGISLYNRLFRSPQSFRALETRCRAGDDPYCEFVVNPLSPVLSGRL
jgi:hypothetical protein